MAAAFMLAPVVCAEEGGGLVGWVEESLAAQRPEDTLKPLAQRFEQRHVTLVADTPIR